MNSEIFSVYDSCAKRYLPPFFAPTIDEALRSFRKICNEPEHAFYQDASDYSLFHLGSFNAEFGTIVGGREPHNLGLAASFLHRSNVVPLDLAEEV